jgi:hypothetical protein
MALARLSFGLWWTQQLIECTLSTWTSMVTTTSSSVIRLRLSLLLDTSTRQELVEEPSTMETISPSSNLLGYLMAQRLSSHATPPALRIANPLNHYPLPYIALIKAFLTNDRELLMQLQLAGRPLFRSLMRLTSAQRHVSYHLLKPQLKVGTWIHVMGFSCTECSKDDENDEYRT